MTGYTLVDTSSIVLNVLLPWGSLMISPNYFLDDNWSAKVQFFLIHQKVKYNVSVT